MKLNKMLRVDRGFTLIEIIFVIVIGGMISAFTFAFLYKSLETYRVMRTQRILYQDAVYSLERITRELHDASTTFSTNGATISFMKPSRSTPTYSLQDTNAFVRYYLSGTSLYRCSDGSAGAVCLSNPASSPTNRLVATNVTSFLANGTQGGSFSLNLELQKEEPIMKLPTEPPLIIRVNLSTLVTPKNYLSNFKGDWQDVVK